MSPKNKALVLCLLGALSLWFFFLLFSLGAERAPDISDTLDQPPYYLGVKPLWLDQPPNSLGYGDLAHELAQHDELICPRCGGDLTLVLWRDSTQDGFWFCGFFECPRCDH